MSTADSVNISLPTAAFLAIAQTYENDIRQAADMQTNSTPIAKLDLSGVGTEVEREYYNSHHEKTSADYSTEPPSYKPSIFLLNGGSYRVPAGFVVAIIPLVIIGTPTARARFSQRVVEIPLQAGSVICFAAATGEARLETGGGGRVVSVFFLFKAKG